MKHRPFFSLDLCPSGLQNDLMCGFAYDPQSFIGGTPLLMLSPQGPEAPIFLAPPISGSPFVYKVLGEVLGANCAVFSAPALGLDGLAEPIACVEAIAAAHLSELESLGVHSPRLAGWSFGGLIAFEMARQLQRAGHSPSVVLIDAWGWITQKEVRDVSCNERPMSFAQDLFEAHKVPMSLSPKALNGLTSRARSRVIFSALSALELSPPPLDTLLLQMEVYLANLEALASYRPGVSRIPITLIRATQPLREAAAEDLGWGEHTSAAFALEYIPECDHYGLLGASAVAALGHKMMKHWKEHPL